jgi:hypothetical protein
MNNSRYIFFIGFISFLVNVHAQSLVVESFNSTNSVEARTHKRLDTQGIPCALIKVRCLVEGLQFKEAIGSVENKTNEYWVYVPDKSEVLTTSHKKGDPIIVRFADYGLDNISTNVTYVLSLTEVVKVEKASFTSKNTPSDYQTGAENGKAEDQCNLGKCLYKGQGVAQNYYTAVAWFRKAAEQNYAEAQYYLGRSYYYGQGFPRPDYEQAVKWYEKAAKQDYPEAQYELGLCYEKGQGVKQNFKIAHKWYKKAAANGNNKAKQKIQ